MSVRTRAGLAWPSAVQPREASEPGKSRGGEAGRVHPPVISQVGKLIPVRGGANPRRPQLAGHKARCVIPTGGQVAARGLGAPGFPPPGALPAHLPRTWEAAAAAAAGRSPSGCGPRGPSAGVGRGQQPPAAARLGGYVASAHRGRSPGRPARGAHTPGPRRAGRIRSAAAAAAARRPPAPGGALGAAWPSAGRSGRGATPGCGLHRGP